MSEDLPRWLDKILIAAGDTLLLLSGRYTARYRDRLDALATVELGPATPSDLATIRAAYERKLWGGGAGASASDAARIVEAVLRRGLHESLGDSFGTDWSGFPAAFVRRAGHDEAYLRYLPTFGPAAVYESAIVALRARRAGLPLGPAAFWNCVRGRPLSLLTQACAAPIGLALLDNRVGDMRAGAAALVEGGIPISTADLQRPSKVGDTLRRYWSVTA
jgi:hypothetical protein